MKSFAVGLILFLNLTALASNWSKTELIGFFSQWRKELSADKLLEDHEKFKRLEFVDRMIYQLDRRALTGNAKKDLSVILADMAFVDEMSSNKIYGSNAKFLKNLEFSLKEILEPSENVLKFFRSYTEFSSVTDPMDPDTFANLRSYSNGVDVEMASPITLDEAAEIAEEKLNSKVIPDKHWFEFNLDLTKEFGVLKKL